MPRDPPAPWTGEIWTLRVTAVYTPWTRAPHRSARHVPALFQGRRPPDGIGSAEQALGLSADERSRAMRRSVALAGLLFLVAAGLTAVWADPPTFIADPLVQVSGASLFA